MTHEQQQLLINASNSMISYLTTDELEKYSEAEQAEEDARQAQAKMIEEAKARNISGWQDAVTDEEKEILNRLPPELQEAYLIIDPEEFGKFIELRKRECNALLIQTNFMRIAAARAES